MPSHYGIAPKIGIKKGLIFLDAGFNCSPVIQRIVCKSNLFILNSIFKQKNQSEVINLNIRTARPLFHWVAGDSINVGFLLCLSYF